LKINSECTNSRNILLNTLGPVAWTRVA